MKKILPLFAVVFFAALTGCKSSRAPALLPVPYWMSEIPPDDVIWGVGKAELQNENQAMETAVARAQRQAALQISVLVQDVLTGYSKELGLQDDARTIQSIENIVKDLEIMNLTDAIPNARTRMPDGMWWGRVAIEKAKAQGNIHTIIDNEMADFAEFRAEQALIKLDAELSKYRSRIVPRTED